jgi:hypothetical protein
MANFNADGIWSAPQEFPRERPADKLRIAIYGGSYAQGGAFETGWGHVIEKELNAMGVPAEVLNFGVAGYGIDQALLRWRKLGKHFNPHVVVVNFSAGNCENHVNLVRLFRDISSGIPFLKPRFIIGGNGLELINSPTPAVDDIASFIAHLPASPLAKHEYWYRPRDYRKTWWRYSRLVAWLESRTLHGARMAGRDLQMDGEPAQITAAIFRQFRKETEAAGARFVAVHMPSDKELKTCRQMGRFSFQSLYDDVKASVTCIPTEDEMLEAIGDADPVAFFHDGHYKPEFQAITGRAVAKHLAEQRIPTAPKQ